MGAAVARRAALAAQGLDAPARGSTPDRGALKRLVRRLGLLQLDSVNVAVRAHYAPPFARLGPYDRDALDALAWPLTGADRRRRAFVEFWAHEASLLPVEDWPLLRWRMRDNAARTSRWLGNALDNRPDVLDAVHDAIAAHGPLEAREVEQVLGDGGERRARAHGGWWHRSDVKVACEHLFATGVLTTGTRRGFRRAYAVTEDVLPADVLARDPDRGEAMRELTRKAAVALGVATEPDLRDHYRLPPAESRAAVAELVDAGELTPVEVKGWDAPAYRAAGARVPRKVTGRALLAPFDPLVWFRPRTERIFDFTYRIGIYTPAEQRTHGYYVFPFLLDGQLVGRVDLKTDRAAGVLRVPGAFAEPECVERGADEDHVAIEMAGALWEMAAWLGVDDVVVEGGPLAPALSRALAYPEAG
ncbi:winged helix DNA-binding domain-containing protein [Actinomycetospora endophytica]|uniref:Winged helix DNA-binding domain-containing protein n=1 Tax=Actinomycetospora endophytica TaxID=2291215 RepID=A0ABS8PG22_9PSEU|nr:crosslink repair DNA glycosylase YcaQ family protein [Actinomycetospora endophytica]MCD2197215.1 winged helix DNA-binding domain-containing protein [Actinomycetospora endophytica]